MSDRTDLKCYDSCRCCDRLRALENLLWNGWTLDLWGREKDGPGGAVYEIDKPHTTGFRGKSLIEAIDKAMEAEDA